MKGVLQERFIYNTGLRGGSLIIMMLMSSQPFSPGSRVHPKRLMGIVTRWQSCGWFLIICYPFEYFPTAEHFSPV